MPGSLIQGNALHIPLKDKSVQLCCFSPPYWNLRKYSVSDIEFPDGWIGQLGSEPNIDRYLDNLMLAMAEVWRVLRDDGCVFVNIGDSYWNASGSCRSPGGRKSRIGAGKKNAEAHPLHRGNKSDNPDVRPKSLCLIPQRFAIRCQEAGWVVRSEVIFHKLNPIPESCNDRPTKAHEQVWLLTKSGKYFWDKEAVKEKPKRIAKVGWKESDLKKYSCDPRLEKQGTYKDWRKYCPTGIVNRRNIRSVWTMATEPHPEAHFATFPSKLVATMIRAGSSPRACEICGAPWVRVIKKTFVPQKDVCLEKGIRCGPGQKSMDESDNRGGFPRGSNQTKTAGWRPTCKCKCRGSGCCVVLDPFVGIGTTVIMAEKHGRAGVGMDLSLEYLVDIALKKIRVPVQKMLELRF